VFDAVGTRALRQERAVPVLKTIKEWVEAEGEIVLPRSPLATAIGHVQNLWAALNVYFTQGQQRSRAGHNAGGIGRKYDRALAPAGRPATMRRRRIMCRFGA